MLYYGNFLRIRVGGNGYIIKDLYLMIILIHEITKQMKKIVTTTFVTLFLINIAMSQIFEGINLKEDSISLISKLQSKGFTVVNTAGETIRLSGEYDKMPTKVYIVNTIKSKKPVVLSAYIGDASTWDELLGNYKKYVKVFSDKYGKPDMFSESFKPPYDTTYKGLEMEAVKNDKSNFISEWTRDGINYSVEIFRYNSIIVSYRNEENFKLNKLEWN